MSILMDLNQVMISNLMVQLGNHKNAEVDESMLRHMVLNSIRFNRKKFFAEFGELIICADDRNYWRRDAFPYYKANRRKNREESELDWNQIFTALGHIREELAEVFPYKVIRIDTAEADDIIGTIVHAEGTILNTGEPILILSGDKDFVQLHTYGNVKQYCPTRKRFIKNSDPENHLYELIIKGDSGDGVPNVLMPDNTFVINLRQRPITAKVLQNFKDINNMSSEAKRNYFRNKLMVDLTQSPQSLKDSILAAYHAENTKNRSKLLNFFIEKRLKLLTDAIGDF